MNHQVSITLLLLCIYCKCVNSAEVKEKSNMSPFLLSHNSKDDKFFQDCEPHSLYEFRLSDLVESSKTSWECLEATRNVFEARYGYETSYISFKGVDDGNHSDDEAHEIANEELPSQNILNECNAMKDALSNFGDLIVNLEVDFEFIIASDCIEIIKRINTRCTSLKVLHLNNCHGHTMFADLENDFSTVTSLIFSIHQQHEFSIHPTHRRLNELFPNLLHFHFENVESFDWKHIQGNFTNLQTIRLQSEDLSEASEMQFIELLLSNTHISGLEIPWTNKRLLCKVNNILPKLRVLSLKGLSTNYLNYNDSVICFEDMIRFYFESKSIDAIPKGLGLRHIDYLNLNIPFQFIDEWIDFMENQVNDDLSELKISTSMLTNRHLWEIADKLPNLVKVTIECPWVFSAHDIAIFIEKLTKLNNLKFAIQMYETELTILEELLDSNWSTKYEPRLLNAQIKSNAHLTINRWDASVNSGTETTLAGNASSSNNSSQAGNSKPNACPVRVNISMHVLSFALILALIFAK